MEFSTKTLKHFLQLKMSLSYYLLISVSNGLVGTFSEANCHILFCSALHSALITIENINLLPAKKKKKQLLNITSLTSIFTS